MPGPDTYHDSSARSGRLIVILGVILAITCFLITELFRYNVILSQSPPKLLKDRATATFAIEDLHASDRILQGVMTVILPARAQSNLIDINTNEPVIKCVFGNYCYIKKRYQSQPVYLEINIRDTNRRAFRYFVKTTTLGKFDLTRSVTGETNVSIPLQVPVDGTPSLYPDDSYSVLLEVDLDILGVRDISAGLSSLKQAMQVDPSAISNTYSVGAHPDCQLRLAGTTPACTNSFKIEIQRLWVIRVYVLALSLLPLAFSVLLFFAWPRERLGELLIGLVVVTLAILPLRSVLVPGDIRGLTDVDFVLGSSTVAIFVMGLASARKIAPGTEKQTPQDGEHRPA
jgi:hypothetical protein